MSFELTILGSSSAIPTSERNLTAQVLNVQERFFLIDCGEGTQIQLRRNRIKFSRIYHIFISHLHGDHYFGLPGLLSTFNLLGRQNDLHIYAHAGLAGILEPLIHTNNVMGFSIIYHILPTKSEIIYEDDLIRVKTFSLKHRIPANGFLFTEKEKERNIKHEFIRDYNPLIKEILAIKAGSDYVDDNGNIIKNEYITIPPPEPVKYAFCSDTAFKPDLASIIKNVNLLYHEATYASGDQKKAKKTGHSTTTEAATIARAANAGKLLLGHFSARYKDLNKLVDEAREIFPNTEAASDGAKYIINSDKA